ncbi:MAG TPA: hypothetical protein VGO45_11415, partial [Bacteroidia bacterium]|nr:hypothetical protein [Bacteroidia bacterium]
DPYTFEFLFSYKKGWLLYTPVMVFALLGFYRLYRKRKDLFYPAFVFTVVNIYVLSSWDCWWYAASFSQRPMVESYPLLALPLGFFLIAVREKGRLLHVISVSLIIACVALNLFQTWQATHWILDSSRMTKAYYWRIFGKTRISEADYALLEIDRDQFSQGFKGDEEDYYKKEVYFRDFENPRPDIDNASRVDTFGFESKHCLRLDSLHDFAGSFEDYYWNLSNKNYCWLRMTVDVYPTVSPQIASCCLVAAIEYHGHVRDYRALGISDVPVKAGQWNTLHFDYLTPYILHKDDKLSFHFWNNGRKTVYIDNLKAVLWEPKH